MKEGQEKIEKIKEQIQDIIDSEKEQEKEIEEDGHVVIVDKKYAYDDVEDGTKVLNTLTDIEEVVEEKEEDKETQKQEEKKKKANSSKKMGKQRIIILIISILLFLIFLLFIGLFLFPKKEKEEPLTEDDVAFTIEEQIEIMEKYGKKLETVIRKNYQEKGTLLEYEEAVKKVDYEYQILCKIHEVYEDATIYLNDCKIEEEQTKISYGKKQEPEEFIEDQKAIHVYVSKETQKAQLKEPVDKENYEEYAFHIEEKYTDLTLFDEMSHYVIYFDSNYHVQMKDFKKDEKVFSSLDYIEVLPIMEKEKYTSYIGINQKEKWGIYHLETRERVTSHIYDQIGPLLQDAILAPSPYAESLGNGTLAVIEEGKYGVISYETGKEIIPTKYDHIISSGDYLWAVIKNQGHIFDLYGKEYLAKEYEKVYGIVEGKYILIKDNEKVKLIQMNGKILYDYGKLELGKLSHFSGYQGAVFTFEKKNSKLKCIELSYDEKTKKGETEEFKCSEITQDIKKPVLYLYPKKKTEVTVRLEKKETLETTYPKYQNGWKVGNSCFFIFCFWFTFFI